MPSHRLTHTNTHIYPHQAVCIDIKCTVLPIGAKVKVGLWSNVFHIKQVNAKAGKQASETVSLLRANSSVPASHTALYYIAKGFDLDFLKFNMSTHAWSCTISEQ